MDADDCPLEDIFVIGALIYILKASPPADVVNKESGKIRPIIFHVRHQLVEAFALFPHLR
jgi:hypothetical protein